MGTYATIIASAARKLQDAGNAVFSSAELDGEVPAVVERVSRAQPWVPNLGSNLWSVVKQTASRNIALSAGDRWKLLRVDFLEYKTGQDPAQFRNFDRFGDILVMKLAYAPSSAEGVYLYLSKYHILLKETGDSTSSGAVKTQGVVGSDALALKSLGAGTINEGTRLTVAGDSTVYHVIETATIAAAEANVSIWPPLQAIASVDAVVTLAAENTLTPDLEELTARLIAARAAKSKSVLLMQEGNNALTAITQAGTDLSDGRSLLNTVTVGRGAVEYQEQANSQMAVARTRLSVTQIARNYEAWGVREESEVEKALRGLWKPPAGRLYPVW